MYFLDVLLPLIGVVGIMFLARQFKPEIYQDRWHDFFFLLLVGGLALITSTLLASRIRLKVLSVMNRKLTYF